jgi:2'-5' RNA ligase
VIGRGTPERPASLRLFIAVPLPAPLLGRVTTLVDETRAALDDGADIPPTGRRDGVRWVSPDGVHLTLKFLGSTDPALVPAVGSRMSEAARASAPTGLVLRGVGGFPSAGRPRVLWLGLAEGQDALARIAADLDSRLEPHGWVPERRPFHAHLTLARSEEAAAGRLALEALTRLATGLELRWTADRLVLFRSHLGRGPARYEPLLEAALGG